MLTVGGGTLTICMESRGALTRFARPYKNIPIECADCNKHGGMYSSYNTLKWLLIRQYNCINLKFNLDTLKRKRAWNLYWAGAGHQSHTYWVTLAHMENENHNSFLVYHSFVEILYNHVSNS